MLSLTLALALAAQGAPPSESPPKPAAAAPVQMAKYYVVFLRRGPAWTAEQTPEALALGRGHMANIQRLHAEGKLALAGPFLEQSGERALAGLFVFRVESEAEARALADSDPAVKAGRFVYDAVPWFGPASLGR